MASGSCISFDSYIKPQLACNRRFSLAVVYLLTPTSNHNCDDGNTITCTLYIFWLLHQTTTPLTPVSVAKRCISFDSYIKPQRIDGSWLPAAVVYLLTPTSNHNRDCFGRVQMVLYIFWLLHQTTTLKPWHAVLIGCISFDSYIKPQRKMSHVRCVRVVYLLTPTSNHNRVTIWVILRVLYIFWLLHQTTT